ncbi:MAG: RNA polymerase sigma factor [Sedimentisphaerales bacterium]|nr:RNA polymerase sigma factor [Sedimentisphaerales bacterium]
METSDQELIARCLDGHAQDYRFLVQRYQEPLLGFLAGHLRRRDQVDDAAQETFIRAYVNLGTLKKADSFFSWLCGIGRRVALEKLRADDKQRKLMKMSPVKTNQSVSSDDYELEKAVARLPQTYQELIHLRFYSGLSCRQVAQKLEIPISTVTKKLSRAFVLLRGLLRQETVNGDMKK